MTALDPQLHESVLSLYCGLSAHNTGKAKKKRGLRHQLSQPSLGFLVRNVDRGLAEALLEVGADGLDELGAVDSLSLNTFHQVHEVILSRINITY